MEERAMRWYRVEVTYAYDDEPYGGDVAERLIDAIEDIVCGVDHNQAVGEDCPRS